MVGALVGSFRFWARLAFDTSTTCPSENSPENRTACDEAREDLRYGLLVKAWAVTWVAAVAGLATLTLSFYGGHRGFVYQNPWGRRSAGMAQTRRSQDAVIRRRA